MAESTDWAFPPELQPPAKGLRFDLGPVLDAVVSLRSEIPEDAFSASVLGTERAGSGVVIRDDGLILTIGYLITEAESIWLAANNGTVVAGHPLAYDAVTVGRLRRLRARSSFPSTEPPRSRFCSAPVPMTYRSHWKAWPRSGRATFR